MDDLSASAHLVGGSIDVTLTTVGDATPPARRVVRRRLSFPATVDDGLTVADYSDLFAPGSLTASPPTLAWNVQRWRYLVVNSVAEGGLLQAEVALYTPQLSAQPTRAVVRVNRPSSVWEPSAAFAPGALVTPPLDNGYGYECTSTTTGISGAAPPTFPVTTGATVPDGTAVWKCLGPTTPSWTVQVVDKSVTQIQYQNAGSLIEIYTSDSTTLPACTVTVAAGLFTWTAAGATAIAAGFDIVELQSTTCAVDATHPNHLVFTTAVGSATLRTLVFDQSFDPNTGSWTRSLAITDGEADGRRPGGPAAGLTDGTTYYYASFLSPVAAWQAATPHALDDLIEANGYGYACTTAGTSGGGAPVFPTATGATVADGTAPHVLVWTCLGPDPTTASATATGSRGYGDRMYRLLPEVHRYYDEPTPGLEGTGPLRRFVRLFGAGLDQARSLGNGLLSLHDVLRVDAAYLPHLARWIGWDPDLTQHEPLQRNDILLAPQIFGSLGTIPTLRALVNRMSGWPCQMKELVDNVFLTNGVEAVRLWQIFEATSTSAAAGFSVPAPQASVYPPAGEPAVTQQDPSAFDARPAAVVDGSGTVWLVWHSHRLGSEWQPSTPYTVGSILAPRAANGRQYQCTTAGTSGPSEPAFPPTTRATVADGAAVWICTGAPAVRRRIWLQRLTVDATPINVVSDLADDPWFFDEAPAALFDGTLGPAGGQGGVWIVWSSNRSETIDIWARPIAAGSPPVLGDAAQLTQEGVGDRNPTVVRGPPPVPGGAVSTGPIWVFWESSRRGPTDIWAVSSADNGVSWSASPSRVTTGHQRDRTPAAVVDASGQTRLFYSQETGDGCKIRQGAFDGKSWTFTDVTTPVPGFRDESPAAVMWNGAVSVFWHSNRFGSAGAPPVDVIWQPSASYRVGALVIPATSNGAYYQCTTAGTSGSASPFPAVWQPVTAYPVGAFLIPPTSNGLYYQCTTAGSSGVAAPPLATVAVAGSTVQDGSVVWTCAGTASISAGATVQDGGVVWTCLGPVTAAGMIQRFRLWSASATGTAAFSAPAAVLARLSNDEQPAVIVDPGGELHLYFASQESGARFRSRTVDTSATPASKLALASRGSYGDRLHYTYDTRFTTSAGVASAASPVVYARDTVGVYLEPTTSDAPSPQAQTQNLQTTARVRALVAQFKPLQAQIVWYVMQAQNGTQPPSFATPYADVVHTLQTRGRGT